MNKMFFAVAMVAALVVALFSTGQVFAQGTTPTDPQAPAFCNAVRGMGNRGAMQGRAVRGAGSIAVGDGILHDGMIAVYAQELGISVDELNTRLSGGETLAQIAAEKGLTAEQFRSLMTDARSQAVEQAVTDGTLTQEQADWMQQRGARMNGAGAGAAGGRGMRGANAGSADCPYYPQTTP